MRKHILVAMGLLALLPCQAQAHDWMVTANVAQVEASHIPTILFFKIDAAGGSCASNSFLTWNIEGSTADQQARNVEAVFALLMTAKAAGRTVTAYGNNAGCTVDFIYMN